jgi:hypothetical protein
MLISDNAKEFRSEVIKNLCEISRASHRTSVPYYPQSHGSVERVNSIVWKMLSMYITDSMTTWKTHLPALRFAYNNYINRHTGYSPHELVFDHQPQLPMQIHFPAANDEEMKIPVRVRRDKMLNTIRKAREKMIQDYNKLHRQKTFRLGEYVRYYQKRNYVGISDKLLRPYLGPYKIVEILPQNNVKIELVNRKYEHESHFSRITNISFLKPMNMINSDEIQYTKQIPDVMYEFDELMEMVREPIKTNIYKGIRDSAHNNNNISSRILRDRRTLNKPTVHNTQ